MLKARFYLFASLLLFMGVGTASAAYFQADSGNNSTMTISKPVADDAYLAGSTLALKAPIAGDLFAAGKDVQVEQKTERSIFVAANDINIKKGSGYNVFAAGTTVNLSGEYDRDIFIAATNINLADDVVVRGDLHLAGETIKLAGKIGGGVYAYSTKLESKADIAGNLEGTFDQLAFTGGSIGGDLNYRSANSYTGLNEVKIVGKTNRTEVADSSSSNSGLKSLFGNSFSLFLFSALTFLILGGILILLFPKKSDEVVEVMWADYLHSWVKGFLLMIVAPGLILLAGFTFVGWRLAFLELSLYCTFLLLAGVYGRLFLGRLILRTMQTKNAPALFLELLIGVLVMGLLGATSSLVLLVTLAFFGVALLAPALGALLTVMRKYID